MVEYKYNPASGQTAIEELNAKSQGIQSALQNFNDAVAPSLSEWDGQARADYNTAQSTWNSTANQMHAALVRATSALNNIHENYLQTEKVNSSMFG